MDEAVKLKTPRMFLRLLAVGSDRLMAVGRHTKQSHTHRDGRIGQGSIKGAMQMNGVGIWWRMAFALIISIGTTRAADPPLDLGSITEKHEMVPDGATACVCRPISIYPVAMGLGQCSTSNVMRTFAARARARPSRDWLRKATSSRPRIFAALINPKALGSATARLGWQEKQRDGYDTVEWLANQKWSTGKIGTMGGSQAGYAQNFLAVTQPPHLVAQYMTDTGLSLYHEGYRIVERLGPSDSS